MIRRSILAAIFIAILPLAASAQSGGPVKQNGNVTPGHSVMWTSNGTIQDAGSATAGLLTELGVTKNGGCAIGVNSGPLNLPFNQMCFGVDSIGGYFTIQGFGSLSSPNLRFIINGTTIPVGSGVTPSLAANIFTGRQTMPDITLTNAGITTVALTCNGTNDNSAALQAVLNQPNTVGILPAGGVCTIKTPLVSTASNNGFQCAVGTTSYGPSCQLKYTGPSGGKMISFITSSTAANRLNGSQVKGIQLNGNGLAADGIYTEGLFGYHFDDLTLTGFNGGYAVDIEPVQVAASALSSGDSTTTQDGTLNGLTVSNAAPFTSGGVKAGYFPGGGNTSYNTWKDWVILTSSGATGFYCPGCDNDQITLSRFFGSSSVPSIDLSCGGTGGTLFCANGIVFDHVYASGQMLARGSTSFACTAPHCTHYNTFRDIDDTNGSTHPTLETGAILHWNANFGQNYGFSFYGKSNIQPGAIFGDDTSETSACNTNALANGTLSTTYFCNGSNAPLAYFDNLGGSNFYIRMNSSDTTANLQFLRPAGTGIIEFSPGVQTDNGIASSNDLTQNIGAASLRYSTINAKTMADSNGSNQWTMDLGVGSTGDGVVTFAHNGTVRMTISNATVGAAFGTGATVLTSSGTRAFSVAIGTTPGTTGTLTFPYAAAHFWTCTATNITAMAADRTSSIFVFESAHADTTHATFTFYSSAMALAAPTAADEIDFMCQDY